MSKTIYCLAEQAFTHADPNKCLDGGGERYLVNFIDVLKQMGYQIKLFQYSREAYTKKFYGHSITGIGNLKNNPMNPTDGYIEGYNQFISLASKGNADGIFFLSLNLCVKQLNINTLSVNHGIIWERCEKDSFIKPLEFLDAMKQWIRNTTHTICVDTNAIHITGAYWPENIKKMSYIPNYFDETKFVPFKKEPNGKFTVLFARRIDPARGYNDILQAMEILHPKYSDIELVVCGKGNIAEELELTNRLKGKENYITWTSMHPDEMYKIYRKADLSVVPTRYSEGTSLSCIEAMATGLPNIVTFQGGLSDLIIPNFNGLIVSPKNPQMLADAIEYCYNNSTHMKEMSENAVRVSSAFTKTRWESQIKAVVKTVFGDPE